MKRDIPNEQLRGRKLERAATGRSENAQAKACGYLGMVRRVRSLSVPILEFVCNRCLKRSSQLVGMTADGGLEPCPWCGSTDIVQAVSRFRRGKTEDDRLDEMADRLELQGEPDSPSAMREIAREMGKAMDEDMSDEMEEMFESDTGE
jgi:hypothetical protein